MRLSIGGIFAKCGACEGNDFYPALPLTSSTRDIFVCVACGSQSVYSELVAKIAKEAVRRAAVSATKKVAADAVFARRSEQASATVERTAIRKLREPSGPI
jgi:hypothetical protein